MGLDVFRNIFGQCSPTPGAIRGGYDAYSKADMNSVGLRCSWNYLVNADLFGRCIVFPVLMKPVVQWSCQNYTMTDTGNAQVIPPIPMEKVLVRCYCDAFKLE